MKYWKKLTKMYEVLIRLYYELDYRRFTIKELKEIKEILQAYPEKKMEVKILKKGDNNE